MFMKKPIQISIPTPCHENWQDMKLVERGRFCDSCQTKVFDLAELSDKEIVALAANDADICVTAKTGQLNRNLESAKNPLLAAATLVLAGILSLSSTQAAAQTIPITEQKASAEAIKLKKGEFFIHGVVSDSVAPLSDVLVWRVKKKGKKKVKILSETTTNSEGAFSISIKIGEFLILAHTDYEPLLLDIVDESPALDVIMEKKPPEGVILLGKIKVDRTAIPKQKINKPANFR